MQSGNGGNHSQVAEGVSGTGQDGESDGGFVSSPEAKSSMVRWCVTVVGYLETSAEEDPIGPSGHRRPTCCTGRGAFAHPYKSVKHRSGEPVVWMSRVFRREGTNTAWEKIPKWRLQLIEFPIPL